MTCNFCDDKKKRKERQRFPYYKSWIIRKRGKMKN